MDISKLFNRPLADEGENAWTGQGPSMDLRGLQAGEYKCNSVPFRVEKGNACFIMKNKKLPSDKLPDSGKVDVKIKADMLAFLHSGGWLEPDVRHATYILHYDDGTKAEIPIIGGKNILDWTTPADGADDLKYDPAWACSCTPSPCPAPSLSASTSGCSCGRTRIRTSRSSPWRSRARRKAFRARRASPAGRQRNEPIRPFIRATF